MKRDRIPTSLWDPSEHLETDEDRVMYLEATLDDGDPALICAALGDIARAKGMGQIAEKTGLGHVPASIKRYLLKDIRISRPF